MTRSIICSALIVLAGWLAPAMTSPAEPADSRPNIVFIFIDDMGYGDLSCTGNRDVETVNIDRLAAEGVRLTQFYVASPICSPSRVAVTTGQYPARHLINSYLNNRARNRARGMRDFLDPRAPCVARAFQGTGYASAHFGKWHMGGGRDVDDAPLPAAYGFDESLVSFEGLGDRVLPPGGLSEASEKLGRGTITHAPKDKLTEIYVDRAIDFIQRNRQKPFYLHLCPNDVHDAHVPSAAMLEKYHRFAANPYVQRFYAVLDEMDRQIGRLVEAIDSLGLAERTLIVLTSDNGPTAWPHYSKQGFDPPGSTAGFRGRKWSLYEGGIRMPLVARWKGTIPAGVVNHQTVMSAVDLFPTFCKLAGVDPPAADFDGEDLSAALLGGSPRRKKPVYWEFGRDATYLKPADPHDQSPNLAIRDGRWKLLINADGSGLELYDFAADTSETNSVAAEHPEVAERLSKLLLAWRRTLPVLGDEGSADSPTPRHRLVTRWAELVTPQNAWPEYPRPQIVRPRWLNLNGLWDYAIEGPSDPWPEGRVENAVFDPLLRLKKTTPEAWHGKILVPFCVESALSGVGKIVRPSQVLWYRRQFDVPADWSGDRVLLNCQAVDWHAVVWLNGREVGEHKGGYDPFTLDVTDALQSPGPHEIVMAVWDPTNVGDQAVGKQSLPERRRGFRYTPTSGIWQTVWLEPVPKASIERLKIVPDVDRGRVLVTVATGGQPAAEQVTVEVLDDGRSVGSASGPVGEPVAVALASPRLWSPDDPFLYDLKVTLSGGGKVVDSVASYFGMRKVSLGKDDRGIPRVFLNNAPLPFQLGPLDQGYWPDGILTPPADAAAAFDVEYLKQIGCNMARVHVKVHPERWYYHCDRLGLLVWQDMVCTRKFDPNFTAAGTAQWEAEQRRMIDAFGNHPSIIQWIVFNEGWGQYGTERLTEWTAEYDPTRLVVCASGWTDVPGLGHVRDIHDYSFYPTIPLFQQESPRTIVLGEFGGFNVLVPGHVWHAGQTVKPQSDPVTEGGRESYADGDDFLANYRRWVNAWRYLIAEHGLSAGVYTQICDVEHELNGWLTYDRRVSKIDVARLREIHELAFTNNLSRKRERVAAKRPVEGDLRDRGQRQHEAEPAGPRSLTSGPSPAIGRGEPAALLPLGRDEAKPWRYLAGENPPRDWFRENLDDSGWQTGPLPLGNTTGPVLAVQTEADAAEVFLRRTFTLDRLPKAAAVVAYGRGEIEVYLNGQLAKRFAHRGPRDNVVGVSIATLTPAAAESLRKGQNLIAVRSVCRDDPKHVDVALVEIEP